MSAHQMTVAQEARELARRLGFRPEPVEKWMRHAGLGGVIDLMRRYPGKEHAEAMRLARDEIERFVFEG